LREGVEELAGVQRQYAVAELFLSLTDIEAEDEDDGVESCWSDDDGEDCG